MQESSGTHEQIEGSVVNAARQEKLAFDLDSFRIEPLESKHNRGAFVCTNQKIQNYFRNNARKNNDKYMVRVFVACLGTSVDVVGYYYMALTSYKIKESDDGSVDHLDAQSDEKFGKYGSVPAVYLGMIGVHSEYQRCGIGKMLMIDAIQRTAKIAQHAGLYALALDAVDESVARYYRDKFDFQTFKAGSTGLEMFLPISTLLKALPVEP